MHALPFRSRQFRLLVPLLLVAVVAVAAPADARSAGPLIETGPATTIERLANGDLKVTRVNGRVFPGSPPIPAPEVGREGLHFSAGELAVWRQRAVSGPYRRAGDAGVNAPGDWDRIVANKEEFLVSPMSLVWDGPTGNNASGCVQRSSGGGTAYEPNRTGGTLVRDAAFYALVKQDTQVGEAVKTFLLAQADVAARPHVNFGNRARWCTGVVFDSSPSFNTSHWTSQLLFAYDYLGRDFFTAAERQRLDVWHAGFADFLTTDINLSLNKIFEGRPQGNYGLKLNPSYGELPYKGAPVAVDAYGRHYNNRRAAQARYVALVGVHQGNATLKNDAKRFAKEVVMFGVYPQGFVGDFDRWTSSNSELGFIYSINTLAATITIADVLARSGDTEVYDFVTTAGAYGSVGKPTGEAGKSLLFAIKSMGRYLNGTHARHATDGTTSSANLIDGLGPDHAHASSLVLANRHYREDVVKGIYTQQGPGMKGYPAKPATNGPSLVWTGDAGIFPGVLFMFAE